MEDYTIQRNSFIQMSKLTNVRGRIHYISSQARQENLYAVYGTTDRKFWRELAKCNQEEFSKSGTAGKCIEARELIIALPESMVDYQPDRLLKLFTDVFKQAYGVECIAALHHNKRKTNYHIHLIFSERKLMAEPVEKIATRNMFYDKNGRHVRTKKEILDESGNIRKGCKVVKKGEVYERKLFTIKDKRFKGENFLDEVKRFYTDLINIYVKDDKEKLKVFDRNGMYLPKKKIGKNNPRAEEIKADNEVREQWNQTVDRALVSGVPETRIMEVKRKEISRQAQLSIRNSGRQPGLFKTFVLMAVIALELLITMALKGMLAHGGTKRYMGSKDKGTRTAADAELKKVSVEETGYDKSDMSPKENREKQMPQMPVKSVLASKFPRLSEIYYKLEQQNTAIYRKEQQFAWLEADIAGIKGIFKGRQRKDLQGQAERMRMEIASMKRYLSGIVQGYGYKNVKEFLDEYAAAKKDYDGYKTAIARWEEQAGKVAEPDSIRIRLQHNLRQVQGYESGGRNYGRDRGRSGR